MAHAQARPKPRSRGCDRALIILLVAGARAGPRWLASVRQRLQREGAQVLRSTGRSSDRVAALAADQEASAIVIADPGPQATRRRQLIDGSLRERGACGIPVLVYAGRSRRGTRPVADAGSYRSVAAILQRLRTPLPARATASFDDDAPGGERPCQLRIED